MNPITPPDLDRFEMPGDTGEPATDETRRPDSADDTKTGTPKDLPDQEPEPQAPEV